MTPSCSFLYFYFSVFFLMLLNHITNQNQYRTVRRAAFVVGNNVQLVWHFCINFFCGLIQQRRIKDNAYKHKATKIYTYAKFK